MTSMFALPLLGLALMAAQPAPAPETEEVTQPAPPVEAPPQPAPTPTPEVAPAAETAAEVPATPSPPIRRVPIVPPAEVAADPANRLTLELSNGGQVVILLRPDAAPQTVARIKALAGQGFYNGLVFHRVIPGFMAQGGDPLGDGTGGSPLPDLPAEFTTIPHLRGTVSAARAQDPNSANSQFYIMFAPRVSLDGKYTVFGRVISGMDVVDRISVGEPPAEPTRIVRATVGG